MNSLQNTLAAVFASVAAGIVTHFLLEWTKTVPDEFRLKVTLGISTLAFLASWMLLPRGGGSRVASGIRAKGDVTLSNIQVSGPDDGRDVVSDVTSKGKVKVNGLTVGETTPVKE